MSGVVSVKTEGGPDGKVNFTIELAGGQVTEVRAGAQKGADIELTMSYDLAGELLRGEADPAVGFMRGTLKLSGDMAVWLDLLPAWQARIDAGQTSELVGRIEVG